MDDPSEGMQGCVTLTGELRLRIPPGVDVELVGAEIAFAGPFSEQASPFRLTLEGAHGELQKLRSISKAIADILVDVADKPADATGMLVLEAKEAHVRALRKAARGIADADIDALVQNAPWMSLLFQLDAYRAISVGTNTRMLEFS